MNVLFVIALLAADATRFERHEIDAFPAGYQVAVADVNGDGKPDVIGLSTDADRVDWYENPTWQRRPVARTAKNIDLAPLTLPGSRRPAIALASGFYFDESTRGGQIEWLTQPEKAGDLWTRHPIAADPVVHRIRWGDLDGDGRPELIHAPLFGPGSKGPADPKPAHLWAFRLPRDPAKDPWETWKIDETLTVLHGIWIGDLDGDGRDEILTASYEGIHRFDFEGTSKGGATKGDSPIFVERKLGQSPERKLGQSPERKLGQSPERKLGQSPDGQWRKVRLSTGAPAVNDKPGASRGSSEVAPGRLGPKRPIIAAIEPWHGNQVVVYTPAGEELKADSDAPSPPGTTSVVAPKGRGETKWQRHVLDDTLNEGHVLVVADFDRDGRDEIIAGWRAGGGGLRMYRATDASGHRFERIELDPGMPAEGAVAADINGDGRLDLVVMAGRKNKLVWYENRQ